MDRIITVKEIAVRFNIFPSTAFRPLHVYKSIGLTTITGVRQMAKELNYEPSQTHYFFSNTKPLSLA